MKASRISIGLFSTVTILLVAAAPIPEKIYQVELPYRSNLDVKRAMEQGFDIGGIDLERKVLGVLVRESAMDNLDSFEVLRTRQIAAAPDQLYKKPADVEKILGDIEAQYPNLANAEVIGKSVEGRNVMAIHVTNFAKKGNKRAVVFDAMHHAREIMTPEVALDIAQYLTKNYATDPKVKKWVDSYDIWVVPMVNPDGNNNVWTQFAMWRKNMRDGHGVDINRNYPYAWNTCNGSSGSKNSDTYRGDKPASEPETNALMDLVKKVRPMFNISYHSYSEIVIYPFGCSPNQIPEAHKQIYQTVGKELAKSLVRDSGTGSYTAGTSFELLYNVDGGSIDWMYDYDKIMAFVIEMNSMMQGFQPSYAKWRDATVEKQRAGWQYILDRMSGPGIK